MAKQIKAQPGIGWNMTGVSGQDYTDIGTGLLYIGQGGSLVVDLAENPSGTNPRTGAAYNPVTYTNLGSGVSLPYRVNAVYSGGTTCRDIVFHEGPAENRG